MNRDREQKTRRPNPFLTAGFFSKITFWWLKPMFSIGLKRSIEEEDIYAVTNDMRSDTNTEKFARLWEEEVKKKKPSIFRVMFKLHLYKLLPLGILYAIGETIARLLQPICLGGFVGYFAPKDGEPVTLGWAYAYASGIVFSTAFMFCTFHPFMFYAMNTSCKTRVACSGLIYKKALRILKSSTQEGQNGKIINLLSNDLAKFDNAFLFIHEIWKGPLQAILFMIVIHREMQIAGVIGVIFLLAFIPLQAWIGKRSGTLRMRNTKRTDFRVRVMNEIILGIQVIKMYAWEHSFAKMVDQIRKKEVSAIRSIAYVQATIHSLAVISKVSLFLSIIIYVFMGNKIDSSKVFTVSSYFNILDMSMLLFWPLSLAACAEAFISIKRLQEFLLEPESKYDNLKGLKLGNVINGGDIILESKDQKDRHQKPDVLASDENGIATIAYNRIVSETAGKRIQDVQSAEKFIRFESATAVWEQSDSHQMNGVFDLNVKMGQGLCAVVGPVGSCKSTLLNVILGELELDAGTLAINGSLSYASQEPWLFEGSVRSNIVFVEDFNQERYNKVVHVCALERDFQLLPQGDATIVGEKGSSLSGGQRARVNLARAIYKQADIYLLDDPLSAVDTHVGKHIFEMCIEEFLADKICVLVTHQLQYLKNVEHVLLMNSGKIEAEGPFHTLERFNKDTLMMTQSESVDGAVDAVKRTRRQSSTISFVDEDIQGDPNDRTEHQYSGSIKLATYKKFFMAVRSNVFIITVFGLFLLGQATWSGADYFLSDWVTWEEEHSKDDADEVKKDREKTIIIYSCIMILGIAAFLSRSFSFYQMCIRISINLHDMIFRGVTRAKMIFFNNNPSGRILNRFARDINNVDSLLPNAMFDVVDCFLHYLAIIIINMVVNPWLTIPALVMTVLFYLMRHIYINTGRSFKRVEALSRSPIFSHVNATLQGLPTVRVCNGGHMLEHEFHHFQNHNTSCWYLFNSASRWFALWLDIISLGFSAFVTYSFLLLGNSIASGKVGLAILSSINLIGLCQWGMRQSTELENQMTSVERIVEYAELPSEPPLESNPSNKPPSDWPKSGRIEFRSLSLRYAEKGHRVLRKLAFHIDAKEKVGVVGRTGAGKSSMIQALFRLAENEGQIFIDDVDVGVIGLHDLRKNISIIPQEAVLFSGTLRFNLDPFGERSDDELWNSLEQVELMTVVSAQPGGLDCKVQDGGSNFSVGQRQLFCLARAILRNNKILILDEATANVDSETDNLIQQTIRRQFANCTVITIAHRLNTVMDSDKVLVVDAGEVVEYDHPYQLIQKPNGYFKGLLDQTGSATSMALTLVAKESYERHRENL